MYQYNINKRQIYLISNNERKLTLVKKLHQEIQQITHIVPLEKQHIHNKLIRQFLIERNKIKLNLSTLDENIYLTISSLHIVRGEILNFNNLNADLVRQISGKRVRIYNMASISHRGKEYHRDSKELYVNTIVQNINLLSEKYNFETIVQQLLPRYYQRDNSILRTVWCLINNLI